ncbi:MAG: NADH-quinone oxidoreductase subunit D [Puniceicoccales bacterium]|jgi:NADH:ubiquinone oxidoreductase subunit D/NADH:ubiquinone oxidoreductase subunit C|nr:NADH-quinone oxidoreductase subunit D [Puniceicoccales bacterium]
MSTALPDAYTAEKVLARINERFPNAATLVNDAGAAAQHSLLLANDTAGDVAAFLRDDPELRLDFCSNVTGVDWLKQGYLEAVYHLYSVEKKSPAPVVVRLRTQGRGSATLDGGLSALGAEQTVPSLTPVWASCELQEREVFDLYGIVFAGHPDLRRLLMWDEFVDFPMRKDYVEPDDYEWEPTPHDKVLEKAKAHWAPAAVAQEGSGERDKGSGEQGAGSGEEVPAAQSSSSSGVHAATTAAATTAAGASLAGDLLEVSMGPHHPSTHGVFRMNVTLDGEVVTRLKPVFGYLHRNHEKIAEQNSYLAAIPFTDRLDYLCSLTNNWAYVHAVERLAGVSVPERAEYLRVILGEVGRLINHACLVGFLLNDLGTSFTPLLYSLREREILLDLVEELTGSRMMYNFYRFGGLRTDVPADWLKRLTAYLDDGFARYLDEQDALLTGNEILLARTQHVGVLPADLAISAGITGPMLRASGVNYDIRKTDAYSVYDKLKFRVPLGAHGDTYDRYMMRMLEMRESVSLIKQAIAALDTLPPEAAGVFRDPKTKNAVRPKAGECYARIEGPKGEIGFHLISDGTGKPYRYRIRPPSLINLTALEKMCIGQTLADTVVILGSVDIVLGEVDR